MHKQYSKPKTTTQGHLSPPPPLARWRMRYESIGLSTIPLGYNAKTPAGADSWLHTPPAAQWQHVGPDFQGNIGLRAGGGFGFIDADNPAAAANVRAWLADLNTPTATGKPGKYAAYATEAPLVQTPHGLHVYIRVKNVPPGFAWSLLPGEFGAGEVRLRRAYVVAPSSRVFAGRYVFIGGAPENLERLPAIDFPDLARMGILADSGGGPRGEHYTEPPVLLQKRPAPAQAVALLNMLQFAPAGRSVWGYPTRSEAEAAAVAFLILAGWDLLAVDRIFRESLPGHYADKKPHQRDKYLELTYSRVTAELASTPERAALEGLYTKAAAAPWAGRGGAGEKRVYRALIGLAWPSGTMEQLDASRRELAELAAMTSRAVANITRRLHNAGYIRFHGRGRRAGESSRYSLTGRLPEPVAAVNTINSTAVPGVGGLEVFNWSNLGHTAELVYTHLPPAPAATVADLCKATGKGRAAVLRALRILESHGLATATTAATGKRNVWGRGAATLRVAARRLEAQRAEARRAAQHTRERDAYHAQQ